MQGGHDFRCWKALPHRVRRSSHRSLQPTRLAAHQVRKLRITGRLLSNLRKQFQGPAAPRGPGRQHITEFYTYMKATRDSLRALDAIKSGPPIPATGSSQEHGGPTPWQAAVADVIYV